MQIIQVKDINQIKYLLEKYNNRYIKPLSIEKIEELSKKFKKYAIVYKAVENNTDLGYISFYLNNREEKKAFISQICVSEDSTNRGVGKLLINKCVEECKENKISIIQLNVYSINENAINFYKKMGFFIKNKQEECIYMEKKID